jgi:hypothetical protein
MRHCVSLFGLICLAAFTHSTQAQEKEQAPKAPEPYTQNQRARTIAPAGLPADLTHAYSFFKSKCGTCHLLNRNLKKSNLSADEWSDIVYRMKDMASSHMNEGQAKDIARYLRWEDQHRKKEN